MSKETTSTHTNLDELIPMKIPIFSGMGAENALAILEHIAKTGPLLKYDVF